MHTRQITLAAVAGLSLSAALAGCADDASSNGAQPIDPPAAITTPDPTVPSSAASTGSGGSTGAASGSSTYADGTYEAKGSYVSPAGTETVDVSMTLKGDVITAVTVSPEADDATALAYQKAFAGGISQVVVGKDIDAIQVSRVAGSSLTSGGFNKAVTAIKADAS
jgi:hypothetical protein